VDPHLEEEIAAAVPADRGDAAPGKPQPGARLDSGRQPHRDVPGKRGDLDAAPERGFRERQRQGTDEVVSAALDHRMRSDFDVQPEISSRLARKPLVTLSVHDHRRPIRNPGRYPRDHPDGADPAPAPPTRGTGGVEQHPLSGAAPARTGEHHVPVAPEPPAGAAAGGALDSLGRRFPHGELATSPARAADLPAVHAQPHLLPFQRLDEGDPFPGVDVGIGGGGFGVGALGRTEDLVERPLLLRGLLAEVEPRESVDPLDPGGSRFRPAVPVVLGAALGVTEDLEGPLNLPETLLDDAVVGVQIRMQAPREAPVRLTDPQDVGVAVKDYLLHARPVVDAEKVFLRMLPPLHQPLASGGVSAVAQAAIKRSGVKAQGLPAGHVFRHSAATNLLRDSTPLEVISTLLRHQSTQTTALYARVDVRMLREVAQPWPVAGEER